jgi:hypothetical protein
MISKLIQLKSSRCWYLLDIEEKYNIVIDNESMERMWSMSRSCLEIIDTKAMQIKS